MRSLADRDLSRITMPDGWRGLPDSRTNDTHTAVGLPPYYIEWHTAIPQVWQSQLIGLVLNGMFDRLPDLRVAMIESGWTWLPSLLWRLDLNYRSLRREVPWVKRMPSEYVRESVGFSSQPMEYPDDPRDLYVVCALRELRPGDSRVVSTGSREVLVVRTGGDSVAAASGGRRSGRTHESLEGFAVVCPWHNFEFDLSTGCPPYAGAERCRPRLRRLEAVVEGGDVVLYV